MATVEETIRQARYLSEKARRRVENDIDVAYEKSKSILESWDVMKWMDVVWTARENEPGKHPVGKLRPYLIGASWLFALFLLYMIYYVDVASSESILWYLSIRFVELCLFSLAVLCLLCCFEAGLDLVMGGLFVISVYWAALTKTGSPSHRRR